MSFKVTKSLKKVTREAKLVETVVESIRGSFNDSALITVKGRPELCLQILCSICELGRKLTLTDEKYESLFFEIYRIVFGTITDQERAILTEVVHFLQESGSVVARGTFRRMADWFKGFFRKT